MSNFVTTMASWSISSTCQSSIKDWQQMSMLIFPFDLGSRWETKSSTDVYEYTTSMWSFIWWTSSTTNDQYGQTWKSTIIISSIDRLSAQEWWISVLFWFFFCCFGFTFLRFKSAIWLLIFVIVDVLKVIFIVIFTFVNDIFNSDNDCDADCEEGLYSNCFDFF